jgi:protein disulfide isomerase
MGFSISDGQGKKFKLPTEYNLENTRAFGQAMADGTATPDYKSEPIPENNKDGEVTVVVGKSFEDIVLDSEKDVLLEVYAPWCGHCKQLEPIYHKLAKRFKKVDSVVIAKMDGTANEHAQVTAEGFPTILFYPAGGEVVSFDGERTLTGMTSECPFTPSRAFPVSFFILHFSVVLIVYGLSFTCTAAEFIKQHAVKPYELPKKKKGDEESGHDEL